MVLYSSSFGEPAGQILKAKSRAWNWCSPGVRAKCALFVKLQRKAEHWRDQLNDVFPVLLTGKESAKLDS